MTRVKICGLTDLHDARHALECGADMLGFNFYSGSKRYLSPENARKIVDQLSIGRENIGVFVNDTIDNVLRIADLVGLDGIQLHGQEDPEYVRTLRGRTDRSIIKAHRVRPGFEAPAHRDWTVDFHLFDSYSPGEWGGTGRTFDWKTLATDNDLFAFNTVFLAGGLTPENVAEAVRIVRPYAVDVAGGVESTPGRKDPKRVEDFIRNAKNA